MRLGNEKALVQGLPLSAEGTIFNGETAGTDNQVREVFSKTMNTVYIYIYIPHSKHVRVPSLPLTDPSSLLLIKYTPKLQGRNLPKNAREHQKGAK